MARSLTQMRLQLQVAALLTLPLVQVTAQQRTVVDISFGWRTFNTQRTSSCIFDAPLNGVQCYGFNEIGNITSAADCQASACLAGYRAWQWLPSGDRGAAAAAGCWAGNWYTECDPSTDPWVGGISAGTPPPPANATQAQPAFDDASWAVVDLPHDATVTGAYNRSANQGQGFIVPAFTWYRKHFFVPASFANTSVTLVVDAALATSTWYLNGLQVVATKPNSYLPLVLRLDTNGLIFGGNNTLTSYCDGSATTGWWYEGSGLIRPARIIFTAPSASVVPFGIATPSYADGDIYAHSSSTADGLWTASAVIAPTATLTGTASGTVTVTFNIVAANDTVVASGTGKGGSSGIVSSNYITLANAELWSVARPYLYTMAVSVSVGGTVVDAVNETLGIRNVAWDAERGLFINGQHVKLRGGCAHESFTGVGAAVPERVDLLRVQQMRGTGFNAWRTSHNPPETVLLDITDRLGVVVFDENRVLATRENCLDGAWECGDIPTYAGSQPEDVGAMATRDRNHPSIAWYSLCNEMGCGDGSLLNGTVIDAKQAAYEADGSRNVGGNMVGWGQMPLNESLPMEVAIDVMGLSHPGMNNIQDFHNHMPTKPLAVTECCSCGSQRGEDGDMPHNDTVLHSDENSECLAGQLVPADTTDYVAGVFVWTAFDYMGEPDAWPQVSSTFGFSDLSLFQKPSAWWYRTIWLGNVSLDDAGRAPLAPTTFVKIVEAWQAPAPGHGARAIHVYCNAPFVALFVNGVQVGAPVHVPPYGMATWNVSYAAGNLTAKALAADGTTVLATHSTPSWSAPSRIVLSIDAPSPLTGTGSAVYLDGSDVALIRASIVDAAGALVRDSTLPVTFAVESGPGVVWGVGNGDPANQDPNNAASRVAYHGLVRAIVKTTIDASGSDADRALKAAVNVEAGLAPSSSSVWLGPAASAPTSITVTASAPGLPTSTLSIPLSVNPADAVRAVAAASVGTADLGVTDL